jgi:hypothetical protein
MKSMNRIHRTIRAIAATTLALHLSVAGVPASAQPAADTAGPAGAGLLLDMVVAWLASNFDLPASSESPSLFFASPETLARMRYGPGVAYDPGEVVAVYRDDENAIYLGEGWDGRTPADLSVVVHEMVHHLQNAAGTGFACPGEREEVAYRAQEEWLGMFGTSLAAEFEIDAMTLMLRTSCAY